MKILKHILKGTEYDREPFDKRLSSSMLKSQPLELILSIAHKSVPTFGQNTIGSLAHLGLERIFNSIDGYQTETPYTLSYKNGWRLTTTIDLLETNDNGSLNVYDYKTTKQYTLQMLLKDINKNPLDNRYICQVNHSRYILEKLGHKIDKLYLFMMLKDGGWNYQKKVITPDYTIVEIPRIDDKDLEDIFDKQIAIAEQYIDFENQKVKSYPKQCKPEFGMMEGKNKKCELYCDYKTICPMYKGKRMLGW